MKKIINQLVASRWSVILFSLSTAWIAFHFLLDTERPPVEFFYLVGLFYVIESLIFLFDFRLSFSWEVNDSNETAEEDSEELIRELYEHIRTRALELECSKTEYPNEAFPLWVNLYEIHAILSIYHNGDLKKFLKKHGSPYDHGFGCDADDYVLPKFPDKTNLRE